MNAAKLDLVIQKGSTFRKVCKLLHNGTPINLVGCAIRSKLRKSFHESTVVIDLHAEITDPGNGKFSISLSPAETEQIKFATGVYDVEIVFSPTEIQQVLFGNVLIKKEATYG